MLRIHIGIALTMLAAVARGEAPVKDHPLVPLLRMAYGAYQRMDRGIQDYTCVLTKRERVNGRLLARESMDVKLRHQRLENGRVVVPFSVFLRYRGPSRVAGREVLYVHGRNHGNMIVRRGGTRFQFVTLAIPADGDAVLQENRYPITEIGVKNLTRRLIEDGEREMKYNDIRLKVASGAKLDGRPCTAIQVTHTEWHEELTYRFARILVDDELQVPVHYSAYDWPREEGGESPLIEEYTYTHLRINAGLSDRDFDHRNEDYHFSDTFQR